MLAPRRSVVISSLGLLLSVGCSSAEKSRNTESAAATTSAGESTAGGGMAMHRDTLAERVEQHLRRLETASADSLKALVSADREVVTTLIADCEKMMREMKMEPPAKWRDATRDLNQDLTRMRSMNAAQLKALMPEHRKRIQGMLDMRRDMMRSM